MIDIFIETFKLSNIEFLFIGDGSMNIAKDCSDLNLRTGSGDYQDILSCSKTTDTNCYFTAENVSSSSDVKVCKFDFTNIGNVSYTEHNNTGYVYSDIAPVDGDNIIVSGFDTASTPQKFVFYSSNHSSTSVNWVVIADTFGKYSSSFYPQISCIIQHVLSV